MEIELVHHSVAKPKVYSNFTIMPMTKVNDSMFTQRVWFNPKSTKPKHSDILKFLVNNFSNKGTVGVARTFLCKNDNCIVKQVFHLFVSKLHLLPSRAQQSPCPFFFFCKLNILYCASRGDFEKEEPILLHFDWFPSRLEDDYFPNELQTYILRSVPECTPRILYSSHLTSHSGCLHILLTFGLFK